MLRIAIVAPPFIEVPPQRYGGTELFIGNLACELHSRGHDVTVYGNGDSRLPCRVKWRYAHAEWPLACGDALRSVLKNTDHTAWSMHDAAGSADIVHLNDVVGVPFTTFVDVPSVLTIHHPHEPAARQNGAGRETDDEAEQIERQRHEPEHRYGREVRREVRREPQHQAERRGK